MIITVVSPDGREAAAVANAFAEQFIAYRKDAAEALLERAQTTLSAEIGNLGTDETQSEKLMVVQERYVALGISKDLQDGDFKVLKGADVARRAVHAQEPSAMSF